MAKCLICEKRAANGDGIYCHNCLTKLEAEKKRRRKLVVVKYLIYCGNVVALRPNGKGKLSGELVGRDPENLPKGKVLNLDNYCEGYSRQQIKRLKAGVLSVASVWA